MSTPPRFLPHPNVELLLSCPPRPKAAAGEQVSFFLLSSKRVDTTGSQAVSRRDSTVGRPSCRTGSRTIALFIPCPAKAREKPGRLNTTSLPLPNLTAISVELGVAVILRVNCVSFLDQEAIYSILRAIITNEGCISLLCARAW